MGVVTATFQYANASPVANGAYQWKLSSDAILFSAGAACTVPTIISGQLDANGAMTSTFAFNDVLSTTAGAVTTYQLTVKTGQNGGQVWNENYYLTGSAANLNLIPPSGGAPFLTVTTSSVSLPSAQAGDVIRFNVNGDSAWDAVNGAYLVSGMLPIFGGNPVGYGGWTSGLASAGGATAAPPSALLGMSWQSTTSGSGTTTTVGIKAGENGSNSINSMLAFYRWTNRFQLSQTTNCRVWMGLAAYSNTGTPNNNALIIQTTRFAADSSGSSMIGFRFSAGTDTNWQAVTSVAGGSQTVVDTGIPADTNLHTFEMILSTTGTAISFWIDGALVATISTNIPNTSTGDGFGSGFWTIDNKNTAHAVTGKFYSMTISHRF